MKAEGQPIKTWYGQVRCYFFNNVGRAVSGLFPMTSHCCQGNNDLNFQKKKKLVENMLNPFFV